METPAKTHRFTRDEARAMAVGAIRGLLERTDLAIDPITIDRLKTVVQINNDVPASVPINASAGEMAEHWDRWYECPSCEVGEIAEFSSYCQNCGARLEWKR